MGPLVRALALAAVVFLSVVPCAMGDGQGSEPRQRTSAGNIRKASARYKQKHDLTSLSVLLSTLRPGMPRRSVEELLGPPSYAPTQLGDSNEVYEPQVYYETDTDCWHAAMERTAPCALVINYHAPSKFRPDKPAAPENLWDTVADFSLGPVGE